MPLTRIGPQMSLGTTIPNKVVKDHFENKRNLYVIRFVLCVFVVAET
jgi:hypothetical protein